MIKITSPLLHYRFKMVRVQCKQYENTEQLKDEIMDVMNDYLQENDGYIIFKLQKVDKCKSNFK